MKKIFISICLFFLTASSSFALLKTRDVPVISLKGGAISAKGSLSINLSKLEEGIFYQISCNIKTSDSTIMNFKTTPTGHTWDKDFHIINGRRVNGSLALGVNLKLDKTDNAFITVINIFLKTQNEALNILNLDNSVTAQVSNCSAIPIEG